MLSTSAACLEGLSSNPSQTQGTMIGNICGFPLVPPSICEDSTLNLIMDTYFDITSNSLCINLPTISFHTISTIERIIICVKNKL
jgi:hypothetical protein